jgi:hypothetical protein
VIPVLMCMSLIGCGYWLRRREIPQAMTPVAAPQPAIRTAGALGIEDDPDQWHAARGAWTTLDERQLIRLLTDSAP